MNRPLTLSLLASAAVLGSLSAKFGWTDPQVNLQGSSPGTQQTGHINVSGKLLAGSLSASDTGASAQVVVGNATSTSGSTYGGLFRSASPTGTGVRGVATATTGGGNGGTFQTSGPTGAGVRGFSTSTTGVNFGVYGKSDSPSGFGVFSQGNMATTGTLTANGLNFPTGAGVGKVLASDGVGNGSWQNDGLTLPYEGTFAISSGSALRVNNTATSGGGLATAIKGMIDASGATAVYGENTAATGSGRGVAGSASGPSSMGVFGRNDTGYGVYGDGKTGVFGSGSNYGVYGSNSYHPSAVGYGVYGTNDSPNGLGVIGVSSSNATTGIGVKGVATSPSGATFGGWFQSASPEGRGLYGYTSAMMGFTYAVFGTSDSDSGRGVYGFASNAGGTTYGVYGRHVSGSGFGLYAQGNSGASGTKSFRIDHPLDPENKYLLHYSSESPEPQNFYNGIVKTDARGEAWVQLPAYFAEINRDFRYTLTVVDDSDSPDFVQVKVAREIRDNKFKIRSSAPNVKVSWEVKAIRNDLWVRRNGAPSEVDKQGLERGTYQRPELYGLGAERGLDKQVETAKRTELPLDRRSRR